MANATFRAMTEGTEGEWATIMLATRAFNARIGERLIDHLRQLAGDDGGFAVDRLQHSLQTASRALRDGRDEEYVACALVHDVGDLLGPLHHAEVGALIMKPYVSEKNYWMMRHHAIFQGYYYFEYIGGEKNLREKYRGHPHFEYTAEFSHLYDQSSFDPSYDTLPLEAFEALVGRVTAKPRRVLLAPDD